MKIKKFTASVLSMALSLSSMPVALYANAETVEINEIASELGFPETVIVAAGAGDNAAAAVGTGTVGDNMCNISLGTSGTIFISSDKIHFSGTGFNSIYSLIIRNR